MELRSLSMADADGTSRETRRTEEAEGGGEWRGQGAGLGFSHLHVARALARWHTGEARGGHATRLAGCAATEGGTRLYRVATVLFLFQTLNDRSKPPQKYKLKLNLRPLLTPNTFSFGTNGSNKCCRAMRDIQYFLKDLGQI